MRTFDVRVIGGGVNGTGIARDGVLRQLMVVACTQQKLTHLTADSA